MALPVNPNHFPEKMGHFFVEGPAGQLEVLTERPKRDDYEGIAVICHPNPLQDGNMTNKVVHTLAKAYQRCGLLTVRFNYRGVGQSEGQYGNTVGEVEDLYAVIEWLKTIDAHSPLWLAGFSFGSFIAAKGASKYPVEHLISVAPAVHLHPYEEVKGLQCPWLMIQGDQDDVVVPTDVYAYVESVQSQSEHRLSLHVMADVGHFFHGRLVELRETVMATCQQYL